jgi:carboxypeptidase Taq
MADTNALMATFREKFGEAADVEAALALLQWDQETYMPHKGGAARSQQLATIAALGHRLFTAPEMGAVLQELMAAADSLDPDDRILVSETFHDYDRATRLPERFVHAFAAAQSTGYQAWIEARREERYAVFQPHLERLVDLLREKADLLGYEGSPYNALLEDFERGMTREQLAKLFGELAPRQSELVRRIMAAAGDPGTWWLDQQWEEAPQWALTLRVLRDLGFDLDAGRQDKSEHPFTTSFDICDVRITTRIEPRDPFAALLASVHECGHALYEQGFLEKDRRTVLASAPSLGMHESQSRLWENIIGRSLPFWRHYTPCLKDVFPGRLDGFDAEDIHRAVNRVTPSLIRVYADECTYNLHIVLRFELEVELIENRMKVKDIPDAWNAKIKQYLDLDVPDDVQGCLQDIHWAHGGMGYFPTYALGNLYAAQIFEQIMKDIPDLWANVEAGHFGALREWLHRSIHIVGRRKRAVELMRATTGREPSPDAYLRYLERKYGELYGF